MALVVLLGHGGIVHLILADTRVVHKRDFHLQFRSRPNMLWCLADPRGRLNMRSCLLVHASFISAQPAGTYSMKYDATLAYLRPGVDANSNNWRTRPVTL